VYIGVRTRISHTGFAANMGHVEVVVVGVVRYLRDTVSQK